MLNQLATAAPVRPCWSFPPACLPMAAWVGALACLRW